MEALKFQSLPRKFFAKKTEEVAPALLGKYLVSTKTSAVIAGKIVEVEAYFGPGDPASHARRGVTPRTKIMFGRPGIAYIYLNYGMYCLLNVVTEPEGRAGAVLIRALEPRIGIEVMRSFRRTEKLEELCSGPGKICQALAIDLSDNGLDLTDVKSGLFIAELLSEKKGKLKVARSKRIGVREDLPEQYRFYIADNKYVSTKSQVFSR
jgi:DNA-3-methyladenine glycosylase